MKCVSSLMFDKDLVQKPICAFCFYKVFPNGGFMKPAFDAGPPPKFLSITQFPTGTNVGAPPNAEMER